MEDYNNPYAPPKSNLSSEETETNNLVFEASKSKRFLNHLIDIVVIYLGTMLISALFVFAPDITGLQLILLLFAYSFFFVYYILMESTTQKTIGKMLTKTKVVDITGNKPSLGKIIGRTFSRCIPFEALSFLGANDSGLHDRISGTKVIDISSQSTLLKNKHITG